MEKIIKRKGQVWIETVIYTLIGITIIAILLAFSKPKIESMKDKMIIDQTIASLNKINEKIYDAVKSGPGNRRSMEVQISKGRLILNSDSDSIIWILDSNFMYSEPGINVTRGDIKVKTIESGPYTVSLWLNYTIEMTNNGEQKNRELNAAPSPYKLFFENKGTNNDGKIIIDFSVG